MSGQKIPQVGSATSLSEVTILAPVGPDRGGAARPLVVVEDHEDRLTLWLPEGTARKVPATPSSPPDPSRRKDRKACPATTGPVGLERMDKAQLARRLYESCYLTGHFVLRSGQEATFYFDKYQFEAAPMLLRAVAEHAAPLVPAGTQALAGLELGGVPVATALSLLTGLPQVMVRKKAKAYGTAKLAEGPPISGKRLLVVEDVVTTGGQVLSSVSELRALGALVDDVLCIIDRSTDNPASTLWQQEGLRMNALFRASDLTPQG